MAARSRRRLNDVLTPRARVQHGLETAVLDGGFHKFAFVRGVDADETVPPCAVPFELAARDKEMNILCWEGYNSAQVLDPFRKKTGATVKAESLTNDPTMINRLRAGETIFLPNTSVQE